MRDGGQNVSHMTSVPPESGMTTADSFVLDVLRGWRLQAASLNREEWRDILSATNNNLDKLDFDSISNALQVLWDEQLMQPRSSTHHGPQAYISIGSRRTTPGRGMMTPGGLMRSGMMSSRHGMQTPGGRTMRMSNVMIQPRQRLSPLEDPQIREALQSEKIAENLAAEARLTWQKAQEATSAPRKDRGFGAVMSGGKGKSSNSSTGCFICGDPGHMARECPDRMSPKGKGKSKSKFGYTSSMWDPSYDNYVMSKGTGKFKG